MAKIVNMHYAKTHLSRLVDEAAHGAEIIIARAGKPVVRLVPEANSSTTPEVESSSSDRRVPGGWEGKVWYAPNYDKADAEIEAMFYESINGDNESGRVAESE